MFGVPIYMSPQILSKNYYSYKCDVWSLGIVIYEMYFESLPWKTQDVDGLFFEIMNDPFPFLHSSKLKNMPNIIQDLLKSTLQYLEKDRLSWKKLL